MTKLFLMIIPALICGMEVAGNTRVATKEQTTISLPPDTDATVFVDFVKKNGQDPKSFMLDKLANHKLVVYGELHKRKASWDLLKSIIKDPSFPKKTGIIFLEMSSHSQKEMDSFFANETIDKEILLDILRDVQVQGWDDRGMYEFIIDLWNLNKGLSEKNRIKVVIADIPRPWSSLKTTENFRSHLNNLPYRDEVMADIIENNMKSRTDERGGLFIVGWGHALKTKIEFGRNTLFQAGARLKERFSDQDVYITYQHGAILDNIGNLGGLTRNGIFDYAFEQNGNNPIAFNLADSPFGKERFDAFLELNTLDDIGNYENYFDGFIFLMPLKDEGAHYRLPELITENFIQELRRRAEVMGNDNWQLYGVKVKDITLEDVQKYYQQQAQGKYWKKLNND